MTISQPPPPLDDPNVSNPLECPPLRWGLIGCGRISNDFTQALKLLPTAKVQACSARSLDSAKAFAAKHGIEKTCKCCRDLLFWIALYFIVYVHVNYQLLMIQSWMSQRRQLRRTCQWWRGRYRIRRKRPFVSQTDWRNGIEGKQTLLVGKTFCMQP